MKSEMLDVAWENSPKQKIGFILSFSRRSLATGVVMLGAVNLFMLATTALYLHSRKVPGFWNEHPLLRSLFRLLDLASESTVATWYSSMLILLVSLAAALCLVADRQRFPSGWHRFFSHGWLFLAAVFLGLSLDEMGALHERIGMMEVNPFSDWSLGWISRLIIPIGIVACFMLAFAWVHLIRNRWALLFMALGTLLYVSLPLQEWIEVRFMREARALNISVEANRPILQVVAEEGTELFGSLVFLTAFLIYLYSAARRTGDDDRTRSIVVSDKPEIVVIGTTVVSCLFGLGMATAAFAVQLLPPYHAGIPLNWFPSALAILIAAVCLQIWSGLRDKKKTHAYPYLLFSLSTLAVSIYYGADLGHWLHGSSRAQSVIAAFLTATIFLGLMFSIGPQPWWSRIGIWLWALLLGLRATAVGALPLDFVAFAFLLVSLSTQLSRREVSGKPGFPLWPRRRTEAVT